MPRKKREPAPEMAPCLSTNGHDVFTVTLPLPPRALSPNHERGMSRQAVYGFNKVKRAYQEMCVQIIQFDAQQQGWLTPVKARINIQFGYRPDRLTTGYAAADWDNSVAAFKYPQDALRLAGVISDDRWERLVPGEITMDKKMGPGIRVTIERLK